MSKPRELTEKQCRDKFLQYIANLVTYWADYDGPDELSCDDRLSGLAFSILSTIDGSSVEVPAMLLAPAGHKDDKDYLRSRGLNWWPSVENGKTVDIAGGLHERWAKFDPVKRE